MNLGEKICSRIMRMDPAADQLREISLGDKGRVKFRVSIHFLCGGDQKLIREVSQLDDISKLGHLYIDTIGEHIVRKHIDCFTKMLCDMSEEDYVNKLLMFNHIHFSIQKCESDVEISLHVSYLHDALLDIFLSQPEDDKNANGN